MKYYLSTDRIDVEWSIYKGVSNVKADFSRATLAIYIIGECNQYTAKSSVTDGVIRFTAPRLPVGGYNIRAIWTLNDTKTIRMGNLGRSVLMAEYSNAFFVTDSMQEPALPEPLRLRSSVAVYGYDGMGAWELAVFKGMTELSQDEWIKDISTKYVEFEDLTEEERESLRGPRGIPGPGTVVKGTYRTLAELEQEHPIGDEQSAYIIAPYIYIWSSEENRWVSAGNFQGPRGAQGLPGKDGDKGEPLRYADLTEQNKEELRRPMQEDVEKSSLSAAQARNSANLSRIASDSSAEMAAIAAGQVTDINAAIQRIVEMGGQGVQDILAALSVTSDIADLKAAVRMLNDLLPYEIDEDAWDALSEQEQNRLKMEHVTIYVTEGGGIQPQGGAEYDEESGIITLFGAEYDEETEIITLSGAEYDETYNIIILQ